MSALVVMLLLAYCLVIAASLTIWAALGLKQHTHVAAPRRPVDVPAGAPAPTARPSNDEVRGAHVKVSSRSSAGGDAFERFLHSDRQRDESEF